MRAIILLKKVRQDDFLLMMNALNNYASTLQMLQEIMPDPKRYMIDISITAELWYDFNVRTATQNPPENSNLKLSIHKALILVDAINEMKNQVTSTDFEKSRCRRFLMTIDEQLPTPTQLLTKLNN